VKRSVFYFVLFFCFFSCGVSRCSESAAAGASRVLLYSSLTAAEKAYFDDVCKRLSTKYVPIDTFTDMCRTSGWICRVVDDRSSGYNRTLLHKTFRIFWMRGDSRHVLALLKYGEADVNASDALGDTILHYFARSRVFNNRIAFSACRELMQLLDARGADFSRLNGAGRSPLSLILSNNFALFMRAFLEFGKVLFADVERAQLRALLAKSNWRVCGAREHRSWVASALLSYAQAFFTRGVDSPCTASPSSSLFSSSPEPSPLPVSMTFDDLCSLVLSGALSVYDFWMRMAEWRGALNACSERYEKRPLLHLAFLCKNNEVRLRYMEVLLRYFSVDPAAPDEDGNTVLHLIAQDKEHASDYLTAVFGLLLRAGQRSLFEKKNADGDLPFDVAIERGRLRVVRLFIDSGEVRLLPEHKKALAARLKRGEFKRSTRTSLAWLKEVLEGDLVLLGLEGSVADTGDTSAALWHEWSFPLSEIGHHGAPPAGLVSDDELDLSFWSTEIHQMPAKKQRVGQDAEARGPGDR